MIVRKISNPKKSASKAVRILRLTQYIRDPGQEGSSERCLYASARGFITEEPRSQTAEMLALSQEAVRSKDTINHYVLSWQEGEQPCQEQVEEAVSIFMEVLDLKEHQAVYALHVDTDNVHLHLAINRVHPETLRCVEINRGFDIEAAHKAIALVEHAQGWKREQNGRYQILENGVPVRGILESHQRKPRQPQMNMEHRTGERSAERIAIEEGASIIKRSQTWEELHQGLAERGMRYEKTGSGATIFVGDIGVKASRADRATSFGALQKRLGPYQAPMQNQNVARREPEPIKPGMSQWDEYIAGRKAHYAERDAAKQELDKRHEEERQFLKKEQKARRDTLLEGRWKGKGNALNALRSVIASEQAVEKLNLKDKHRKERELHWQKFRPYPDYEQWQRIKGNPEIADRWRLRASEPQHIEGDRDVKPVARDIRDFKADLVDMQIHYSRKSEADNEAVEASFIDKGRSISVYDWRNRDSVLAALQVSAQKWGNLTISGTDEYKALCVKLAAEHGFRIANPDLQDSIRQERQVIEQARTEARKSEQFKQFERYSQAVGAERYRVTSIKMRQNGSQQAFILDKKDGVTKGFTAKDIELRTPEMLRLQRRGENLYYTPLSERKHHVLIDDLTQEKLDRLLGDGYKPAVIMESSPGNFQAIITVPKLGTTHDKDVGNRLAEQLNQAYGDAKLSGCIHPHRAPGYENRKPKHQRDDGSYPEVRLIKAEYQECEKTLELSHQIDAEYQKQAALKVESRKVPPRLDVTRSVASSDIYQQHYQDILSRQQGSSTMDLSRVDSMIAIRMRITGHKKSAIEAAIRQGAPKIRPKHEV